MVQLLVASSMAAPYLADATNTAIRSTAETWPGDKSRNNHLLWALCRAMLQQAQKWAHVRVPQELGRDLASRALFMGEM